MPSLTPTATQEALAFSKPNTVSAIKGSGNSPPKDTSISSTIYNYEKNIKLAPSPYYTLDKFYGNLNIQEYRKLLKHERLLLIVEKPLSKLLPELYDENEDYILNNKSLNNKLYKINVK
jgi:hypothetical protein